MRKNFIDITGQRFGRLTAVSFSHTNKANYFWKFRCDCGNEITAYKANVTRGLTTSCGCFRRENSRKLIQPLVKRTHGMTNTRFFKIWVHAKHRCSNVKQACYKHYGGRGIKFMWTSFEHFKDDMYASYLDHVDKFGEKQTTLDRINNDGNYELSNCRWATYKIQNNNHRQRTTYGGKPIVRFGM